MLQKGSALAVGAASLVILSSLMVLLPERASASSMLWTTDQDFNSGSYFNSTGFATELHGSGVDAYVQNRKDLPGWVEKFPGSDPGKRSAFGFANDSSGGRFVLFGGVDASSTARNDTWEYDIGSGDWVRTCADDTFACGPWRRSNPSMAYDNNSKVVVMYGGIAADFTTNLEDTWEYDVSTHIWENWSMALRPRALMFHKMTYDPIGKQMVLVGQSATGLEVWAYNPATHQWTKKSPSGGPSLRYGFGLGFNYEVGYRRVVLFGGAWMMSTHDDTWEYSPQADSWTNTTPSGGPSARADATMTYVSSPGVSALLLWGGTSGTNETWKYWHDSGTPTWAQLVTPISPGPPRKQHGFAFDPGHNVAVIYGGWSTISPNPRLNDTWLLERGYRLEGRYASNFLNTHKMSTAWGYIFWNETPSNVPPNTLIRFQVDASNTCNESDTPMWRGPDGTVATYYTVPGQSLGISGFMCLRWLADMITSHATVAPMLQDVTMTYNALDSPPKVISYFPWGPQNPINAPLYINFSKPMDTASVAVSIQPNVSTDFPWTWYSMDTKLKITHKTQPFLPGFAYHVCVWGKDKIGLSLDYPGNKYCWIFTTRYTQPTIVSTDPAASETGVSVDTDIVITFSEAMNTSTCWPYIITTPAFAFTHSWSYGDTVLVLHPTPPLQQFTQYTIEIPIGDPSRPCLSASGAPLTFGGEPNLWSFTTAAINPFVLLSDPAHLTPDVPLNKIITVNFSKETDVLFLTYVLKDMVTGANVSLSLQWVTNTTVRFTPVAPFSECNPYQMHVWVRDLMGRPLIDNPNSPNPWRFQTLGTGPNGCPPYMMFTDPQNGQDRISPWENVTIGWLYHPDGLSGGGMDPASFMFRVNDPYMMDVTSRFTTYWFGMGNDAVQLNHTGYPMTCGKYTARVLAARDKLGRSFIPGMAENPFSFWVIMSNCPPRIIRIQPINMAIDVSPSLPVRIEFSKPMDTAFFNASGFSLRPDRSPYTYTWSYNDTNVTITHAPFFPMSVFEATVVARDKEGNWLEPGSVPNPWRWYTTCGCYIIGTSPANGEIVNQPLLPIYVNFSLSMNTSSFVFSLTPTVAGLTFQWTNDDKTVRIQHTAPFVDCTVYTARVVSAKSKEGWDLMPGPVPNPWSFIVGTCNPVIVSTTPSDGSVGVALSSTIVVTFSEVMNPDSFIISIRPSVILNPPTWPNQQTAVVTHNIPFNHCTAYNVTVSASDPDGNSLIHGPVPNPWTFFTDSCSSLSGLQVHRMLPNDVLLTWNAVVGARYYLVFHSNDRFAPWPWTILANVTTNSYTHLGAISDMRNHFYIVRGYLLMGDTGNSTMGVLWNVQVTPTVGRSNTFWFSLPYHTLYGKASDIVTELTEAKISVVAKWDPVKQQSILYYYFRGRWRGPDFTISPGEGLWISVQSAFDWAISGTDKSISITFNYRNPPKTNYYWLSLALTNKYATASELVLAIEGGLGPNTNTKIDELGKWDFASQTSFVYKYGTTGWGGNDFVINTGDAIWVRITSSFTWSPVLITPEVP